MPATPYPIPEDSYELVQLAEKITIVYEFPENATVVDVIKDREPEEE